MQTELIASTKLGSATALVTFELVSLSKGGQTPTAMVRAMREDMILTSPTQPTHEILSRVWMEAKMMLRTEPTMTHATVQVAWDVMAFRAIEKERRPEPAIAVVSSCEH